MKKNVYVFTAREKAEKLKKQKMQVKTVTLKRNLLFFT